MMYQPVSIDGRLYSVRLPTGGSFYGEENEWDEMLNVLGKKNPLYHARSILSWCQDTDKNDPNCRVYRGQISPRHRNSTYAHRCEYAHIGYRPVLEPLDAQTLQPAPDTLCEIPDVAEHLTCMIEQGRQDEEVFSSRAVQSVDIQQILHTIDAQEQRRLTSFTPMEKTKLEPRGRYTGHVATLSDVRAGIALDGIAQGKFHGDYSSITTNNQNSLMESLVYLNGFCLDYLIPTPERRFFALDGETQQYIIDYLKTCGTDISTKEKLALWIRENPDKCALPENRHRKPALEARLDAAASPKSDVPSISQNREETKDR